MRHLLLMLLLCVSLMGCSTKAELVPNAGVTTPLTADSFRVGTVVDSSGYTFEDSEEAFSLEDAMKKALESALSDAKLGNVNSEYILKTTILSYSPGNAFARWMMPGAGATKLKTETTIETTEGTLLATIPVERTIAAGGGYTVGAWKYVFDDAAEAIAEVLKKSITPAVANK